ncbi:hypothetical protein Lesp01_81750 [Lentzea sp. NBRC 102530]|nr:hypothetical protein Lesp01_81750 [Lentzea sp. NBRC 102530]
MRKRQLGERAFEQVEFDGVHPREVSVGNEVDGVEPEVVVGEVDGDRGVGLTAADTAAHQDVVGDEAHSEAAEHRPFLDQRAAELLFRVRVILPGDRDLGKRGLVRLAPRGGAGHPPRDVAHTLLLRRSGRGQVDGDRGDLLGRQIGQRHVHRGATGEGVGTAVVHGVVGPPHVREHAYLLGPR